MQNENKNKNGNRIGRKIIDIVNAGNADERRYINDRTIQVTEKFHQAFNLEKNYEKKGNEFWNNECDAFKHTYMQAYITISDNEVYAWAAGNFHEFEGSFGGQPSGENQMDLHNNKIGRQIGRQMLKDYGVTYLRNINAEKLDNMIGVRVIEKMQNGELITHPRGYRTYNGKTVDTEKIKHYRGENLSSMVGKSHSEKFSEKLRQQRGTRADKYKNILENRAKKQTQYSGQGHWVTINGKHVFMAE